MRHGRTQAEARRAEVAQVRELHPVEEVERAMQIANDVLNDIAENVYNDTAALVSMIPENDVPMDVGVGMGLLWPPTKARVVRTF